MARRELKSWSAAVQYFTISAEIRIADGGRTVPIAQVFFGHDVGTGMIYQDANIKVTAVENSHFSFIKTLLPASTSPIPIVLKHLIA